MSRTKKLLVLVIVLALLGGAGWFFAGQQKKAEEKQAEEEAAAEAEKEAEKIYAFTVDTDGIAAISWKCLSRTGSIRRDGDGWAFTDDNGEKKIADNEKVNNVLGLVRYVEASKKFEAPEDMTPFGFDDPTCKVVIEDAAGMHVLVFGNTIKTSADINYFQCGDGFVYTVDGGLCEKFYLKNEELLPDEK